MRIAFLTDVHLDATPAGWQQQPRWCEGTEKLLAAVTHRLNSLNVDFLIYGGDLVERGTPDAIDCAVARLSQIPIPAIVCLGNHDLTEAISYPYWRRALWNWPHAALADRPLEFADCDIIALNNNWRTPSGTGLYWDNQHPVPALLPEQLSQLDAWLGRRSVRPAILALHAPLEALPPELTGQPDPMETPPDDYTQPLRAIINRHPRVCLTLAGHCHATCATAQTLSRVHLTSTSLTEVPYAFPVVDVNARKLSIHTQTLSPFAEGPSLNPAKSWVTGRPSDRSIEVGCVPLL